MIFLLYPEQYTQVMSKNYQSPVHNNSAYQSCQRHLITNILRGIKRAFISNYPDEGYPNP
jgi:hypothetical protein